MPSFPPRPSLIAAADWYLLGVGVAGATAAAGLLIRYAIRQKRLRRTYDRLAHYYGGTCVRRMRGRTLRWPLVLFTHDGSAVEVDILETAGQNPSYYTEVRFTWPQRRFRCEVYPQGLWSKFQKLLGMEDIETGSPEFDQRYVIKANDRDGVRRLLSEPLRDQIDRLREFLDNDDIYVSIRSGSLLVKKPPLIREYEHLLEFTQMAVRLYDTAALALRQAGAVQEIQPVEEAVEPAESRPACQVCGEPISSDQVLCRSCKTPHHRDCWEYVGSCGSYGCRETRYASPGRSAVRR